MTLWLKSVDVAVAAGAAVVDENGGEEEDDVGDNLVSALEDEGDADADAAAAACAAVPPVLEEARVMDRHKSGAPLTKYGFEHSPLLGPVWTVRNPQRLRFR